MILEFVISFFIIHILDYSYLLINKSKLSKYIAQIQLEPIQFKYNYVFITYILISYAISLFVVPKIRDTHILKDSITYGLSLGIVIYGVSNLHNMAVFKKQNLYLIYSDIMLRTISIIIALYITKRITMFLKHII